MSRYKSIGTTGTRAGLTEQQRDWVEDFSKKNRCSVLHHGDCIGSDDEVATTFACRNTYIIAHPGLGVAEMRAKCKVNDLVLPTRFYLERNKDIVDAGKELLLGFPRTEIEITRSGTWMTIRYARGLHVPIYVVTPTGKVITWNLE